jgi:deoxyribonuclease-4
MIIGAHTSIAGGINNSIKKAQEIGAEAIQIFITPPQTFKTKDYTDVEISSFIENYKNAKLKGLVFHSIYLLNLVSEKEYLVKASIDSLVYYLNMGEKLGSIGTIFHIGSCKESKCQFPNDQLTENMNKILEQTPENQFLIIENAAGGGGRVGVDLDELSNIYVGMNRNKRIKFCIDTQHLFATGVDVSNREVFGQWLNKFNEKIGIDNLICIHANDSKTECGSRVDRHENIGEGKIGISGFQQIFRQPLLQSKIFICEAPGFEGKGPDRENLDRLKKYSTI